MRFQESDDGHDVAWVSELGDLNGSHTLLLVIDDIGYDIVRAGAARQPDT